MKLISTAKVMVLSIAIIAILIAMVGVVNTILTSVWERMQLWKGTWNMVKVHPFFGFGGCHGLPNSSTSLASSPCLKKYVEGLRRVPE